MRRTTVLALLLGVVLGAGLLWAGVMVTGGWYNYEMLPIGECSAFKRGSYDPSPGHIAPNQPSECYIQTPRFQLP